MEKNIEQVEIGFRIVKIHTSKFLFEDLDEELLNELFDAPGALAVNMNTSLNIDKEKSTISLDVGTELVKKETGSVLVGHLGRTSFLIKGLDRVYDKEQDAYNLPDGLLIQLYSIAYTHARALLATEISPTVYKDKYFLPVVNPADFIKNKKSLEA